jgi:hypothetical protein
MRPPLRARVAFDATRIFSIDPDRVQAPARFRVHIEQYCIKNRVPSIRRLQANRSLRQEAPECRVNRRTDD